MEAEALPVGMVELVFFLILSTPVPHSASCRSCIFELSKMLPANQQPVLVSLAFFIRRFGDTKVEDVLRLRFC